MEPSLDTRAVRAHYADLAGSYDARANRACNRAYEALIRRTLGGCSRVLELGAGSSPRGGLLGDSEAVACDLSLPMLAARNAYPALCRVVADGQHLPLAGSSFDGVFSINVLEHVPDPARFVAEAGRVLKPGGTLLCVTPNGDVAWLLELLERLHLKLPEGPHAFLTTRDLAGLGGNAFEIVEHRSFLTFPAGPDSAVRTIDRLAACAGVPGLFRYILWQRCEAQAGTTKDEASAVRQPNRAK